CFGRRYILEHWLAMKYYFNRFWGALRRGRKWFCLGFDKYFGSTLALWFFNALFLAPLLIPLARWYDPDISWPHQTYDKLVDLYLSYIMTPLASAFVSVRFAVKNWLQQTLTLSVSDATRLLSLLDQV